MTLAALEQPEDPEEYLKAEEKEAHRYPSYWSWPEWRAVRDRWGLIEVSFDQGPMGHSRRKPMRWEPTFLGWPSCRTSEDMERMVAKLNFLGLPLKRLHSDRAGEYQSKDV